MLFSLDELPAQVVFIACSSAVAKERGPRSLQ